jgi:ferric-dicitrate binding protein FerR (iron transport regulator)
VTRRRAAPLALAAVVALALLTGCGEDVKSPDLFLLTRTGQGQKLTLLVNDAGTISCNGRAAKPLPDPLLLVARDLATSLADDAKAGLRINRTPNSVFSYQVRLQDGTIYFPDTAGARHQELARAEQFAVQAAQGPCGLS